MSLDIAESSIRFCINDRSCKPGDFCNNLNRCDLNQHAIKCKKEQDCEKNEECVKNRATFSNPTTDKTCKQKYVDGEGEVMEYCTSNAKCKSKRCHPTRYICVDDDSSARPAQQPYQQSCKLNSDCNTFEECRDGYRCSIRGRCETDYHCTPGNRCDTKTRYCVKLEKPKKTTTPEPLPTTPEPFLRETTETSENGTDNQTNSVNYYQISKIFEIVLLFAFKIVTNM